MCRKNGSAVVALFIVLFVVINLIQGTLLHELMPIVFGVIVGLCVIAFDTILLRIAASVTSRDDNAERYDAGRLQDCKCLPIDINICEAVGPEDNYIKQDIHKTKAVIALMRDCGSNQQEIAALFGGFYPTQLEANVLISELNDRLNTLNNWYKDRALRELYASTGRIYCKKEIEAELRRISSNMSRKSKNEQTFTNASAGMAAIIGLTSVFSVKTGLVLFAVYAAVRLASVGNRSR